MAFKNTDVSDCSCCSRCFTCGKRITGLTVTVSGFANVCDKYYCEGCQEVNGEYYVPVQYNEEFCYFSFEPIQLNGGGAYGLYDPPWNWIVKLEPGLPSATEGMLVSLIIKSYANGSFWSHSVYVMTATTCEEFLAGCDYVFVGQGVGFCADGGSRLHVQPHWVGE